MLYVTHMNDYLTKERKFILGPLDVHMYLIDLQVFLSFKDWGGGWKWEGKLTI